MDAHARFSTRKLVALVGILAAMIGTLLLGATGLLGTVSLATGRISPVAIGFGKPTGLLFAAAEPDSEN